MALMELFKKVKIEFKKVKWPNKEESINVTILVVLLSVGIGIYAGLFDTLFAKAILTLSSKIGG